MDPRIVFQNALRVAAQVATRRGQEFEGFPVIFGQNVLIAVEIQSDPENVGKIYVNTLSDLSIKFDNMEGYSLFKFLDSTRNWSVPIYDRRLLEFMTQEDLFVFNDDHPLFGGPRYSTDINKTTWGEFTDVIRDKRMDDSWYYDDNILVSVGIIIDDIDPSSMFDRIKIPKLIKNDRYGLRALFREEPAVELYRRIERPVHFDTYTDEEFVAMLGDVKLMEFSPTILPFTNFDNNIGTPIEKFGCITRSLLASHSNYYSCKRANGKMIAPSTIIKYFENCNNHNFGALWAFCTKYKIRVKCVNILGRVIHQMDHGLKEGKKNDLNFLYFNGHMYPYTGKKNFSTDFNMKVDEYNCNFNRSVNNIKIAGDSCIFGRLIKELSKPFTENFNYESESSIYIRAIRGRDYEYLAKVVQVKGKWGTDDCRICEDSKINKMYFVGESEMRFNHYDKYIECNYKPMYEVGKRSSKYSIFEIDLVKAYHNIMMNVIPASSGIPIFSVESIPRKYIAGEDTVTNHNFYIMKKEWLDRKDVQEYFIYNNVQMGSIVNYLIRNGKTDESDIDYVKEASGVYTLGEFREDYINILANNAEFLDDKNDESDSQAKIRKSIKESIIRIEELKDKKSETEVRELQYKLKLLRDKLINLDTLKKSFNVFNGLFGRSKTSGSSFNISADEWVDFDKDYEILNHKNGQMDVVTKYDENGEQVSKKIVKKSEGRFMYNNNRNLYNFCVSSCNLVMMQNIDNLKKMNPDIKILRVCTDCITFAAKKTGDHYFKMDSFMNNNFTFKRCSISKLLYTTQNIVYTNPETVLSSILSELDIFAESIESITGGPGTGKTFKVKSESKYQYAMTISNACCRNMDTEAIRADTIYSNLQLRDSCRDLSVSKRLCKFSGKTIWFDEFSMFNHSIFNYIFMSVMMRRSKIIITGDINQIGPICGTGVKIDNPFYAKLFKNNLHLTENHRVCRYENGVKLVDEDCKKLLDLSQSILENLDNDDMAYKIAVEESLDDSLDMKGKNMHLVYTRRCRNRINNYIFDTFGHKFSIKFRSDKKALVEMSKGLRLQVNESSKSNEIYKSVVYETITEINNVMGEKETIKLLNVNSKVIEEIKLIMLRKMVLGFAVTTHSAQGMTIRELCVVHQAEDMIKNDTKILYTAITRMSKRSDLILRTCGFSYKDSDFRCKFTPNDDESYLDEILGNF